MDRNYALDYARAIMLCVGIPYHVACAYYIGGGWVVDSGQPSLLATLITSSMHAFRMHGFFILSGFLASMVLARRGVTIWIMDRARRLLMPAILATLVLGPVCIYTQAYSHIPDAGRSMQLVSGAFFIGWDFHTWFLYTLFGYCLMLAAIRHVAFKAIDQGLVRLAACRGWPRGWVAMLAIMVFLTVWTMAPPAWQDLAGRNAFADYIYEWLLYLPLFLTGVLAQRSQAIAKLVFQPSMAGIRVGVACIAAYVACDLFQKSGCAAGGRCTATFLFAEDAVRAMSGLFGACAFFGVIHRLSPKPHAAVSYLVSGSLVMYLFHLPAVMIAVYLFRFVDLPPIVEMAIINVIVMAFVVLVFEVVRRNRWLCLVFNGGRVRPEVNLSWNWRGNGSPLQTS